MGDLATDYLVVGAGTAGLAFTDELIRHSDADVLIVDRRDGPGGHWNDAYPFVRLHQPSACYGVGSLALGNDTIDDDGPNKGYYERATGGEVLSYLQQALANLVATGRVRFLGGHDHSEHSGQHRVTSRVTGEGQDVHVRRKVVDARYYETQVPATHVRSFAADPAVHVVPLNALPGLAEPAGRYVVLGSGKTAMDAVVWLLEQPVDPGRIRWVRPRDAWLLDRGGFQPLDRVASLFNGLSLELEAAAGATSYSQLFARLEECGRLLRLDTAVAPTMYHCASVSREEIALLQQVDDVVRMGRVLALEPSRMVLQEGDLPASPGDLYVDCTAKGLNTAPARPAFAGDRIVVQQVRNCQPSFNSALIGFVEASRDDPGEQNRLCPTITPPNVPEDWPVLLLGSMRAADAWRSEPDVDAWVGASRLNVMRGLRQHAHEPEAQEGFARYAEHLQPALEQLVALQRG